MNKTDDLLARRYKYLGAGSPLFYKEPLHLVKGEGVWLYDVDGKRYLDVYNNVPHVGHCHPHVVEALVKQASTLNIHTRYLHENIVNYAERLLATFDQSLTKVMFACTGSEANEIALRMARRHTGGMGILVSDFAYHGNTTAVAELGTAFMPDAEGCKNVRSVPVPDSYRAANGLQGDELATYYADAVKREIDAFEADGIKFAGMLVCPDWANEGLIKVPGNYMQQALAHVHEAGGLFIADEVQAGFGRSGHHMWAHQGFEGFVPDIVTMGKPMGNGHPLSGVVARGDLIEEFGQTAMYFNTTGGTPVSMAVGMAVLDVLEQENLMQNAVVVGQYITEGLKKLQKKHDLIGDVRNLGLFFGVELVQDRKSKEPASEEARRIVEMMKDRGVLISMIGRHDNILKMRPPMCFSTENADLLLSTLDDIFASL